MLSHSLGLEVITVAPALQSNLNTGAWHSGKVPFCLNEALIPSFFLFCYQVSHSALLTFSIAEQRVLMLMVVQ